jgi:FMN-dependent NADH-azoreductase
MKTLIINAHPEFDSKTSYSFALCDYFLKKYQTLESLDNLEVINLYDSEIPQLDSNMLTLFYKQKSNETLGDSEQYIEKRMQELLIQFKESKRIVIIMPVHNFNIPSKLKDYIDNILIPHETFKYTENGSVGLMQDGRKILLLQSSGSIYTNNDRYAPVEYGHFYLKSIFVEFMGFEYFDIIRAQGTAIKNADREQILNQSFLDIDSKIETFLSI